MVSNGYNGVRTFQNAMKATEKGLAPLSSTRQKKIGTDGNRLIPGVEAHAARI